MLAATGELPITEGIPRGKPVWTTTGEAPTKSSGSLATVGRGIVKAVETMGPAALGVTAGAVTGSPKAAFTALSAATAQALQSALEGAAVAGGRWSPSWEPTPVPAQELL